MPCNHMLTSTSGLFATPATSPTSPNLYVPWAHLAASRKAFQGMAVWCYTLASDYGGWPGQVNVHTNLGRWSFFSGQKVLSTHWIPRSKSSEASAEPGTRWSSKHNFCDVAFATSGSDRLQLSIANWPNMLIQPTFPRVKLSGLQIKSAILLELLGLKLLKCYKTSWLKPNILHPTNPRKKKKHYCCTVHSLTGQSDVHWHPLQKFDLPNVTGDRWFCGSPRWVT